MRKKGAGIALIVGMIIVIFAAIVVVSLFMKGRDEKNGVGEESVTGGEIEGDETETEMEVAVLTKELMDEDLYEGTWVAFDDLYALYIPVDWQVMEVSSENIEAGVMFQAADQESDIGTNMVVMANQLSEDDEITNLLDIKQQIEDAGNRGVEIDYINDIPVVSYVTDYSYGISFVNASNGIMYTIQIGPYTESVEPYAYNIILSLSIILDEESETNAE